MQVLALGYESASRLPKVVRIYGAILTILGAIQLLRIVASRCLLGIFTEHILWSMPAALFWLAFMYAGIALRAGKRQAVYLLLALGLLHFVVIMTAFAIATLRGILAYAVFGGGLIGKIVMCLLAILLLLIVPPLVSAIRHWKQFT